MSSWARLTSPLRTPYPEHCQFLREHWPHRPRYRWSAQEAIYGLGSWHGVVGRNTSTGPSGGAGIYGESNRADSYGVIGVNGLIGGIGVYAGCVTGTGLVAESQSGNGMLAGFQTTPIYPGSRCMD